MSTAAWDFDLLGILMDRGYFTADVADFEPQSFTLDCRPAPMSSPNAGARVVVVLDDGELGVHLNTANGANVYSAILRNASERMVTATLDAAEADAKAGR